MDIKIHPIEHSYFEIRRIISALTACYPFINSLTIGKSAAGRDITLLTLGQTTDFTLFVGGDDPRCRITTLILLQLIKELSEKILSGREMCGINLRKAMFGKGIAVLPLLNPDGFEIACRGERGAGPLADRIGRLCRGNFSTWGANLRGVELKRNFFPDFEKRREAEKQASIYGPCPIGFSGYRPESEPETAALATFCRSHAVRQLICLSACGQTVTYSMGAALPDRSTKMAEVMAAVTSFTVTPPSFREELTLGDWFSREFEKPGLTLKAGGSHPPEVTELTYWYARLREALTLACLF